MMKRMLACILSFLLMLSVSPAFARMQTVNLPDQEITLRIYGCTSVARQPGTIIRSFTSDQDVAWVYPTGLISGDRSGSVTAILKEYDEKSDVLYVTRVNVTVLPRDPDMDYERDQSLNSTAIQHYTRLNGDIYPVGMKWSFAINYTKDGKKLPVVYASSNPEVASIDQSGMVTMKSAGVTNLTVYCPELQTGMATFITVYSGNTGGNMYGSYDPEDPGATTKVYAQPDKSSRVLYTLHGKRYGQTAVIDGKEVELFLHTLEKGAEWCKVTCQLGTGYIPTSELSFPRDKIYNAPALSENETLTDQSDEVFRTYTVGGVVYGTDSECFLYPKPDRTTQKILTVPVNGVMTVLAESGSFLKVKYDGKTGYVTLHSVSAKPVVTEAIREISLPCTMYTVREIPLFSEPNARGRIAEYPRGTAVTAIAKYNEKWMQVQQDGRTGYMHLDYLSAIKPDQTAVLPGSGAEQITSTMVVRTGNTGKLYMRQEPDTHGKILAKYPNGTKVGVISIDGAWARVSMEGRIGYMMVKFLQPQSAQPAPQPETTPDAAGTVAVKIVQTGNEDKLNLRKEPRSGAPVLTRFPNGTQVEILDPLDETWDHVRAGGMTGYMMDRFLTGAGSSSQPQQSVPTLQPEASPQPEATVSPARRTMYVSTGNDGKLNLREKTDARSKSIERYPNGTKVTVLEIIGEWVLAEVDGRTGYMMVKYLADQAPSAPQAPVVSPDMHQPSSGSASGVKTVQTGNENKLNLRQEPRSGAKVLTRFPNGTQVEILDPLDSVWDYVRVEGLTGYMMDRYLK